MTPPRLIEANRRPVAALLLLLALAQGAAAAGSAEAVRLAIDADAATIAGPAAIVAALAIVAGLAVLGERWTGERLAQSFVSDTRRILFEAVIAQGTSGKEARWLTPLVSDLAALRNWAARGPIRLFTATLAGQAAAVWFAISWPQFGMALLPIAIGLAIVLGLTRRLTAAIADQRAARGALTRFLIRRVRLEVGGHVSPRGHGRNALADRSAKLGLCAERRAFMAGSMEAVAVSAGGIAALTMIAVATRADADGSTLVAGLALIAFIATRLLEFARALHAHIGGEVALRRISRLVSDNSEDGSAE